MSDGGVVVAAAVVVGGDVVAAVRRVRRGRGRRRRSPPRSMVGRRVVVVRARRADATSSEGRGERRSGHGRRGMPDTLAPRRRPTAITAGAASVATVAAMGDIDIVPLVHGAADVTAAWCDAALRDRARRRPTSSRRAPTPVGTGQVADTVRIHLTYDPPGAGPPTLVAKVPSADETSRAGAAATRTYEIEASFYRDLAAELPVRTPDVLVRRPRPGDERLRRRARGRRPGRAGRPDARLLGRRHRRRRRRAGAAARAAVGRPDAARPRVAAPRPSPEQQAAMIGLHRSGPYESFREHYADRLEPETRRPRRPVRPAHRRATSPHRPRAVDGRPRRLPRRQPAVRRRAGRRRRLADGRPRARARPTSPTCSAPACCPRCAAGHEAALVDRYVAGLAAQGVTVDRDDVWTLYRRYAFGGLIMAIVAQALVRAHRPRRRDVHHDGRPPQPPGARPRQRVASSDCFERAATCESAAG